MNIVCQECGWKNPISKEKCNQCNSLLEPDVFISYARADYVDKNGVIIEGNILSGIKETLGNNHITYWFDEDGIYSGEEFASIITSAIRRSKVFLFVSSENSNKSKWTSNEISTAQEYSKPIIPFKIDESKYNDSIMMKIVSIDYIQYKNGKQSLLKLIKALRHYLPQQSSNNFEQTFVMPDGVKGATIMLDMGNEVVEHVLSPDSTNGIINPYEKSVEPLFQSIDVEKMGTDGLDIEKGIIREEELEVNINNFSGPFIVFIGPSKVGKTSVIKRLSQYVESTRCIVMDATLHLWKTVFGLGLPESINSLSMKLVELFKDDGDALELVERAYFIDTRCTILFGEYEAYFKQIAYSKNPKLWVIILEQGWEDFLARENYVQSIVDIRKRFMSSSDKVIFLINKVDNTPFIDGRDNVNMGPLLRDIEQTYPNIFKPFLRKPALLRFFKSKYTCDILPFSAGTLSGETFVPSSDCYPKRLWNVLVNYINDTF